MPSVSVICSPFHKEIMRDCAECKYGRGRYFGDQRETCVERAPCSRMVLWSQDTQLKRLRGSWDQVAASELARG